MAAKCMPPGSIILGIDLMPIKAIRNVKTIVSDITTAECRKIVNQELNGWKADVVLCDGAPNVGAAYAKDAYVQNELVLAALKTATDHLTAGGTFCTKVYRSVDYNSLMWVLQQLFETVQAMKPNSSRSQSSEIFIVCLNYSAPKFIDPKLLDPNHVFKEVADPGLAKVDVLHKKYEKMNKRHRTGYDEKLGILLSSSATVSDFINSSEAIRLLTDVNTLVFSEACEQYRAHPLTTPEILACFEDLRLLGKIDFKKLLKWRSAMKKHFSAAPEVEEEKEEVADRRDRNRLPQTEEEIQAEILSLREGLMKKSQKEKKKARELAARERSRQAMGITTNAFGGEEDMELFNLAEAEAADALGDIDDLILFDGDDEEEAIEVNGEFFAPSSLTGKAKKDALIVVDDDLEGELEGAYLRYVKSKRSKKEAELTARELQEKEQREDGTLESRTLTARQARKEKSSEGKIAFRQEEDALARTVLNRKLDPREDVEAYVKMLSAEGDGEGSEEEEEEGEKSDDESDGGEDSEDDNEDDDEDQPVQKRAKLVSTEELPPSSRAGKWFSNPIFKESMTEEKEEKPKSSKREKLSSAALETMEEMPKTDKELRREKRKKDEMRQQKRLNKQKSALEDGEAPLTEFQVAAADNDDEEGLDLQTKQHRDLISRGMGKSNAGNESGSHIEIVPMEGVLPVHDTRKYDSDNEEYDAHDRAVTLALGTMMLRTSKRKALVDASYNRFAWNDPKDLPSWFLDDEMRHNKPQLPVPAALLEQVLLTYSIYPIFYTPTLF